MNEWMDGRSNIDERLVSSANTIDQRPSTEIKRVTDGALAFSFVYSENWEINRGLECGNEGWLTVTGVSRQ